jgi:hypothetical protein
MRVVSEFVTCRLRLPTRGGHKTLPYGYAVNADKHAADEEEDARPPTIEKLKLAIAHCTPQS